MNRTTHTCRAVRAACTALESLEGRRLFSVAAAVPVIRDPTPVIRSAPATAPDVESNALIGLNTFRADPRFNQIDGKGYSVVVLDTGIDLDSPYFGPDADGNGVADRIVYSYDFYGNNDPDASSLDDHGSNVTSIVAGQSGAFSPNSGMAPGANIIFLKVFSDDGESAYDSDIAEALKWTADHAAQYNIVSLNMSLGEGNYDSPVTDPTMGPLFAQLVAKGVIPVASAGNSFYEDSSQQGVAWPAAEPDVLAVGATFDANVGGLQWYNGAIDYTSAADRVMSFSQRSTTLTDVFAPGGAITGANHSGGSITEYGTSQASPHVAGIVALAQQLAVQTLGRRLTFAEFRNLIRGSGTTINDGDDENDNVQNTNADFKRVNVEALGEAILAMAPPQPTVTGSIAGTYFNDANADGLKNPGDTPVAGGQVYLDANNNGIADTGETKAATAADGGFKFLNVAKGTYVVRPVLAAGTYQTTSTATAAVGTGAVSGILIGAAAAPAAGAFTLPAEAGVLSGGTVVAKNQPGYTGPGFADYAGPNSAVTFVVTRAAAGSAKLDFRYANGGTTARPLQVTVNGVVVGTIACAPTGGWSKWATASLANVALPAGVVSVKATATASAGGGNLDRLTIVPTTVPTNPPAGTIEAETGTFSGGTGKGSAQKGYTGSGYADFGGNGSAAQFTLNSAGGNTTLSIRYANGGTAARPLTVLVNGVAVGSFACLPTGGWTKWTTTSIAATLLSGPNTIKLVAGTAGGGNVDSLSFATV